MALIGAASKVMDERCAALLLDMPPPHAHLQFSVVLPVRNEAHHLGRALAALAAQRQLDGQAFDATRFEVLLLANNCSDDSAAVARAFARRHPACAVHVAEAGLPAELANVGHVRGALMDAACRRLGAHQRPGRCIVSTDGDTTVAPNWLAHTELAIAAGADAVGGRIRLGASSRIEPRTLRWYRLDAAERLARSRLEDLLDPDPADPWPRHHQHFGASLAITPQAYLAVGGLPRVPYLEDQALVDALRLQDLRVRHSTAVKVKTSSRQDGRAEVGLAWQLRQWGRAGMQAEGWLVQDVNAWVQDVQQRRRLRELWALGRTGADGSRWPDAQARPSALSRLAGALGVMPAWLAGEVAAARHFGALWAQVQARLNAEAQAEPPAQVQAQHSATRSSPPVPVRSAVDQLRALIAAQRPRPVLDSSTSRR